MNYWLVKSEPGAYSWQNLLSDGETIWDGVRNYQARNNLRLMKKGDQVLFYHSVSDKQIMGVAEVANEHFQDPTDSTGTWSVVKLIPRHTLSKPIHLSAIKDSAELQTLALVKHSRLSVMPVEKKHFDLLVKMGK